MFFFFQIPQKNIYRISHKLYCQHITYRYLVQPSTTDLCIQLLLVSCIGHNLPTLKENSWTLLHFKECNPVFLSDSLWIVWLLWEPLVHGIWDASPTICTIIWTLSFFHHLIFQKLNSISLPISWILIFFVCMWFLWTVEIRADSVSSVDLNYSGQISVRIWNFMTFKLNDVDIIIELSDPW